MSKGLSSDVVIKLLPARRGHMLSFHRGFSGPSYDLPLLHWQERVNDYRARLSLKLDPIRRNIGVFQLALDDAQIKQASVDLDRVGHGMLGMLLEGTGREPNVVMGELTEFLAPVFLSKPLNSRPMVEIEAAEDDDLALRIPFEFLPIAPAMKPRLAEREDLERFLGFRAEIVRSLRSGPVEIERDASGRAPVHLFADAGDDYPGMRKEAEYLHANASVASIWPDWQALPPDAVTEFGERLRSLSTPLNAEPIHAIGHFSCHYVARGPNAQGKFAATPKLVFNGLKGTFDSPKQAPIVVDIDVLSDELYRFAFAPFTALFFLNACESAAGGNFDNSLLGLLRKRNATAIVGSETLLPDGLAGEFAIEFYRGLLRGVRVGTALLNARRRLLERFGNPVGLFYTFFGNPLMKISEARR